MSNTILNDRLDTAVRNIFNCGNCCDALVKAAQTKDYAYFAKALTPVLVAYEQEAAALRHQRDAALRDAEAKRFALESMVSNMRIDNLHVREAVDKALPGRL